jgi:hypothetical protein
MTDFYTKQLEQKEADLQKLKNKTDSQILKSDAGTSNDRIIELVTQ